MSPCWPYLLAGAAASVAWIGLTVALAVAVGQRLRDRQPPEGDT